MCKLLQADTKVHVVAFVGGVAIALTVLIVSVLNSVVVVVAAVEADTVVAVIVTGVLTVDAVSVVNVVGTVVSSKRQEIQECTIAITVSYFGFIYVHITTVNVNTSDL